MYLSKLELDMRNPSVRQALADCQDMHKNLMTGFDGTRKETGVLYRIERSKASVCLYVLSAQQPDWTPTESRGYRCVGIRDISALRELYKEGDVLAFSLRACPAKKVYTGRKNSRRVFLRTEQERKAWLVRQGDKYGFILLDARETRKADWIEGNKQENHMAFGAAEFQGVLRIQSAERFWQSYCSGFGSGKAYGMGLMLLQRASDVCM